MKLYEMEGFIRGKCIPGDLKVNETNAEYLVRKFSEAEAEDFGAGTLISDMVKEIAKDFAAQLRKGVQS
ncbi:hypothetical protein ABV508_000898 [Salmonella enterica]